MQQLQLVLNLDFPPPVKVMVSQYLQKGSIMYGCLIDALKAFDTADHI